MPDFSLLKLHLHKMKKVLVFLVLLFIISVYKAFPQSKFEISSGLGFPELIDLKVKYGTRFQVGLGQGFFLGPSELYPGFVHFMATNTEVSYHFGKKSKFINQGKYYFLGGLGFNLMAKISEWSIKHDLGFNLASSYIDWETDRFIIYCYPRIGTTINLSKRIGVNLDAGVFIPFYNYGHPITSSGSIHLFFRL